MYVSLKELRSGFIFHTPIRRHTDLPMHILNEALIIPQRERIHLIP